MTQDRSSPPRRPTGGRRFAPNGPDPNAADLTAIEQATLIPLVRRNLNSEVVQVGEWSFEPIRKGAGGSRLYLFSGTGRDRDQDVSWTMYLKVIRPGESFSDPDAAQREGLVYRSGLLDHLPGGIVAPRVFDVVTRSDDATWVWLEEIKEEIEGEWPLERYGLAARHLGQFNGAYLAGQPLPTYPWLSPGWLRGLVARYGSGIESFFDASLPPWMERAFPADIRERTRSLWAGRETLLDALDRLPKTFCHMDAFRSIDISG